MLALAAPAFARTPSAVEVLDHYVQVTGGANLWHAQKWERDEIEGRSLEDDRVVLHATVTTSRFGNSLSEVTVPQQASEGVYRGTAWALSRFSGVRIKRGAERDEAIRESRLMEEADWRLYYPNPHLTGVEDIDGNPCYRVALSPGRVDWFDQKTGLLVRREAEELSAEGLTSAGYTVEQWAVSGGLRIPSRMLAWRGDLKYRVTVLKTAFNSPVSLRYPEEVEAYLLAVKQGRALPNAEEIIERHIFESGGVDAYGNLKTQRVRGSLFFLSTSQTAEVETWSAEGGKYYQSIDIPGLGKQEEGSDGRVAWERSPALGPRVKSRREASAVAVTLDAAQVIGWRYLIAEVRTEALERLDNRDCYRVRLTARNATQPILRWYDRKTGLLYRSSAMQSSAMGPLPVLTTVVEYRDSGGLKWPVRTQMSVSGQELVFTLAEVRLNEPVDGAVFELPEEIRLMAGGKPADSLSN